MARGGSLYSNASKKQARNNRVSLQNLTPEDWSFLFEHLMELDLIDIPDEYYKEEIFFKDPNQFNDKFTVLEENNLFLIH